MLTTIVALKDILDHYVVNVTIITSEEMVIIVNTDNNVLNVNMKSITFIIFFI